jgi:hypothetical protein
VRSGADGHATLAVAEGNPLYQALDVLARHRVPLVSVTPVRPDLEEVFVRLVGSDR